MVRIRCGRRRSGQVESGSLFPVAGALAFPGREEELGYFNSLVGINKLLSHVIKEVPAAIGKGALKESQCNEADVGFLEILKCILWLQPEVFSCGHKGQEAAQGNSRGPAAPGLPGLVSTPPCGDDPAPCLVSSNPMNWRSRTNRSTRIQLQDFPEPVNH